jgi:hypothetical protein
LGCLEPAVAGPADSIAFLTNSVEDGYSCPAWSIEALLLGLKHIITQWGDVSPDVLAVFGVSGLSLRGWESMFVTGTQTRPHAKARCTEAKSVVEMLTSTPLPVSTEMHQEGVSWAHKRCRPARS